MITNAQLGKVESLLSAWGEPGQPGCSLALLRGGETIHRSCRGLASIEHGVAIKPETRFHIASITKTFVAAAAALLAERGRLDLDDDVKRHIPELKAPDRVSLRRLLTMTSGLRDPWEMSIMAGAASDHPRTIQDYLDLAFSQTRMSWPAGTRCVYTNLNFTLMGLVVERVSNRPFADFLASDVLEPLGMTSTLLRSSNDDITPDIATPYLVRPGNRLEKTWHAMGIGGAGDLVSNLPDLIRWNRMFRAGGIGDAPFVRRMTERGKLNDGRSINYGLGLGLRRYRGLDVWCHGGGLPGFRSIFAYLPKPDFGCILLANRDDADTYRRLTEIVDIVLDAECAEPPPAQLAERRVKDMSVPAAILAALPGRYFDRETGEELTLKAKGAGFEAKKQSFQLMLWPVGGNRFADTWCNFEVTMTVSAMNGAAPRLAMDFGGQVCEFERFESYRPASADIDAAIGTYRSEEMDATFRIRRDGTGLVFARGEGFHAAARSPLEPIGRDRYLSHGAYWPGLEVAYTVTAERDGVGRVTGLRVNSDRIKDVRMARV
jgi:CubicO group peptidase (beta-lactamase class C family)